MQAPTAIHYDRTTRILSLTWPDQKTYQLPAEFLRVHSPSAEVRGHGIGQEVLQHGKQDVAINDLEQAGRYALKIIYDDGHDSGLYDWSYLHSLCEHQESLWQEYLHKLEEAGLSRQAPFIQIKQL